MVCLIITTKKGGSSAGKKVSVSWNSSISFEKVNKLPELQPNTDRKNGKRDVRQLSFMGSLSTPVPIQKTKCMVDLILTWMVL
jgi:hypothetical protein